MGIFSELDKFQETMRLRASNAERENKRQEKALVNVTNDPVSSLIKSSVERREAFAEERRTHVYGSFICTINGHWARLTCYPGRIEITPPYPARMRRALQLLMGDFWPNNPVPDYEEMLVTTVTFRINRPALIGVLLVLSYRGKEFKLHMRRADARALTDFLRGARRL